MRESSSGGVLLTPQYKINLPDDDKDDRGNYNNKNYGANTDAHTFLCYGSVHNSLVALRYSLFRPR